VEAAGLAAVVEVLEALDGFWRLDVVDDHEVGLLTLVSGDLVGVLAFLAVFFPFYCPFALSSAFPSSL